MTQVTRKIAKKLTGRETKAVKKPTQKKNPETGNTSTAPAADPKRIESGERLKQASSKGPQKAYDNIQAENFAKLAKSLTSPTDKNPYMNFMLTDYKETPEKKISLYFLFT